jgi:glycosyltransferase involved in cell wall biosynthesis
VEKKEFVFVCQVTRQLCVDILNVFAERGVSVVLYTGEISNIQKSLHPAIELKYFCVYNKTGIFKRLYTWFWFTVQVFFALLFGKKKKELIFVSTPPFVTFLGVFFQFFFKQKYHLIMWDIYPDALLSLKAFHRESLMFKIWGHLNCNLLNKANTVFTLGTYMAEALKQYSKGRIDPLIVPNWVDPAFIGPKEKKDNWFAIQYHQVAKLTVLYSGNMGETHDFDALLKAAEAVLLYPDINFLFIGEGAKKQYIANTISERKLTNTILLGYQEADVFPYSLATGDIGVVALDAGMEFVSLPSKTYSILGVGNALLALSSKNSELGLLIEKYQCGITCEKGNFEAVVNFILGLYKDRSLLRQMKTNAIKAALDFTPANAQKYFEYIYKTNS